MLQYEDNNMSLIAEKKTDAIKDSSTEMTLKMRCGKMPQQHNVLKDTERYPIE